MLLLGLLATLANAHPSQEEAIAKGPLPYSNQMVTFSNPRAGVKLAGTLSVPNGKPPFPAVLLIASHLGHC